MAVILSFSSKEKIVVPSKRTTARAPKDPFVHIWHGAMNQLEQEMDKLAFDRPFEDVAKHVKRQSDPATDRKSCVLRKSVFEHSKLTGILATKSDTTDESEWVVLSSSSEGKDGGGQHSSLKTRDTGEAVFGIGDEDFEDFVLV
ncbi:MAG: hypothetical protein M1830_000978 [Pleopsidium flavum]|nr:MAG: hypothetical protein M1830_000978 [Pleopsidium flavum]